MGTLPNKSPSRGWQGDLWSSSDTTKGAVLGPFPWCEDGLQMELSNIFTRLKIMSKEKERERPPDDIVNMTDVFRSHKECDKPRVVQIDGPPGMGITTNCQKLAYDWSVENIAPDTSFPKVEILRLVHSGIVGRGGCPRQEN